MRRTKDLFNITGSGGGLYSLMNCWLVKFKKINSAVSWNAFCIFNPNSAEVSKKRFNPFLLVFSRPSSKVISLLSY